MEHKHNLLPTLSLFLLLVIVTARVMVLSQRSPAPLPASAPAVDFSAECAFRHVEALGREFLPNNRTDTVLVSKTFVFEQYE